MYNFLVNPYSRSERGKKIWDALIPILRESNTSYQVFFMRQGADLITVMQKLFNEVKENEMINLVLVGGDGSMNRLLQYIPDFSKIRIACIPTGSSNDLLYALGIAGKPADRLKHLLSDSTIHPTDLGLVHYWDTNEQCFHDHYFAVSMGIGYDAAVCEQVDSSSSSLKSKLNSLHLGRMTYAITALTKLFSMSTGNAVVINDKKEEHTVKKLLFSACMIHRYEGGGFEFCPKANGTDGMINNCTVRFMPKFFMIFWLLMARFGLHRLSRGVNISKATSYHIQTSVPMKLHTDGEVIASTDNITVTCLPGAVTFLY